MTFRKTPTIALFAIALAASILVSGCAFFSLANQKLKPPTVAYDRTEVVAVAPRATNVNFHVKVGNPNAVGLQNVRISYQLFHDDKPFLKGNDLLIDLAPRKDSPLGVPAEIVYADVFATSMKVVERVLSGDKAIPVRIDLVISGNPTLYDSTRTGSLFPFTVHLSRTEDVPVPQEQIDLLKKKAADGALKQLRNRF
jgi:LEA14-like dessication related protein